MGLTQASGTDGQLISPGGPLTGPDRQLPSSRDDIWAIDAIIDKTLDKTLTNHI